MSFRNEEGTQDTSKFPYRDRIAKRFKTFNRRPTIDHNIGIAFLPLVIGHFRFNNILNLPLAASLRVAVAMGDLPANKIRQIVGELQSFLPDIGKERIPA